MISGNSNIDIIYMLISKRKYLLGWLLKKSGKIVCIWDKVRENSTFFTTNVRKKVSVFAEKSGKYILESSMNPVLSFGAIWSLSTVNGPYMDWLHTRTSVLVADFDFFCKIVYWKINTNTRNIYWKILEFTS